MSDQPSSPTRTSAARIIDQAGDGCRACANFGTSGCPAFRRAVQDMGVDAGELSTAIRQDQEGRKLTACANSGDQGGAQRKRAF